MSVALAEPVARLFRASRPKSEWFTPLFLAAVPLAQVQVILGQITATLGPYTGIEPNGTTCTVRFARGSVQSAGALDANGAFSGLLFSRMQSDAAAARIAELFAPEPIPADWFSAKFLSEIPLERARAIVAELVAEYGAFAGVAPTPDGTYTIRMAHGTITGLIFLGPDGKIEGLVFRPDLTAA
jgi:hypothetical protein